MDTVEKLNQLGELAAQQDLLRIKKQELIDSVLTPEIKQQMRDIEDEFEPQARAIDEKTDALAAEIKADVLAGGKTVKGEVYQAVWTKGRVKINDKAFFEYLKVHPELAYMRSVGDPSVSIRKNK